MEPFLPQIVLDVPAVPLGIHVRPDVDLDRPALLDELFLATGEPGELGPVRGCELFSDTIALSAPPRLLGGFPVPLPRGLAAKNWAEPPRDGLCDTAIARP
mgnify:CR=1